MKDKKTITVEIPILDNVDQMKVVETFTEEQLWYVCAIAKAFEKLQSNWNSLREFINDWIEALENQRESIEGTDLFENHTLVILDDIKIRINELEGKDKE